MHVEFHKHKKEFDSFALPCQFEAVADMLPNIVEVIN